MRVAIIGARWPDIDVESDVLGIPAHEVPTDPGTTADDIIAAAGSAEVILAGPRPVFDEPTLRRLRCMGIVRYGVGYDNVDVDAATRFGITVAIVPDYGTEAVALHAVGLVLAALRKIPQADAAVRTGTWDVGAVRPLHLPSSLTAGVIGFGRIGRRTAAHLVALGFRRVLAHDAYSAVEGAGVEPAGLHELLAAADVISLHAPGAADGSPLLGAGEIGAMKPGSVLVNTARGSLVDTAALVAGLESGRPATAALDVSDPEPIELDRFEGVLDRMILTPHMAWYSEESERDLRVKAAEEARRLLAGDPALHPVNPVAP